MHQTLFIIPHWFIAGPLLWIWVGVGGLAIVWQLFQKKYDEALWGLGPLVIVRALVVRYVLPAVEIDGVNSADPDGPLVTLGLAIRGYGVFFTMGILAGIGLCVVRPPNRDSPGQDRRHVLLDCGHWGDWCEIVLRHPKMGFVPCCVDR